MKKYIVCKFWEYSAPDIAGQFDKKEDALDYARLSKISSENDFAVYELVKLYCASEVGEGFNLTDLGVFGVYI